MTKLEVEKGKASMKGSRKLIKALKVFLILTVMVMGAGAGGGFYLYQKYAKNLPDPSELGAYEPSLVTKVYDRNDTLVAEYFVERRIVLPFEEIPEILIKATLAVEDADFYTHGGLNLLGIARAMWANLKAGKVVQGGSSITQQVAKRLFLSPERTLDRKIKEALLSIGIEKKYSKKEILGIYLNHIYYGHGAYGVEAAARTYFGKPVKDLSLGEVAILVGLPKAPTRYSPYRHETRAMKRRRHVLNRLVATGAMTKEISDEAHGEPLNLAGLEKPLNLAPWFTEHVRRHLESSFGATKLYRGGLSVKATFDLEMQQWAVEALRAGLKENDKRLGYRGPIGYVDIEKGETPDWGALWPEDEKVYLDKKEYLPNHTYTALVTEATKTKLFVDLENAKGVIALKDMEWAHEVDPEQNAQYIPKINDATTILKRGDLIEVSVLDTSRTKDGLLKLALDQAPDIQGALIAIDPHSGNVLAMVGGYDQKESKFNRATQALRQPGSSFKPIIYTAALDKGFTPSTIVIDSPVIFDTALTPFAGWNPMNFEQKFYGPTTIREAVTHSRNIVTIKTLEEIGVEAAVDYARRFGITSSLDKNLGLALGVSPVHLVEMVSAYGTLANRGVRFDPMFILSVKDSDENILEENEANGRQAINSSTAFLISNIMKSVVTEGTASRVGRAFSYPIAGKTGTTNNYNDAWFVGFTPSIVCGVWVGRDDNTPMGRGETGSRSAIPIWNNFMKKALSKYAKVDFKPTKNIVFARIDKKTGKPTMATDGSEIFEAFRDGTEPRLESTNQNNKPIESLGETRY